MKIAFFTLLRGRHWGGSENLWFKTARFALENGHQVLIITEKTLEPQNINHLKELGAEIFYLENHLKGFKERLFQKFNSSFAEKKFLTELTTAINSFDPNLMVINQPGCYDIVFNKTIATFLELTDKKYVVCFHSYTQTNVLDHYRQNQMSSILKKAKACFFVAKKQAETIIKQLKVDLNNLAYIYNPLNLTSDAYIPYPTSTQINFAMVGSLDLDWKGHDIIINILSKPFWKNKNWTLDIFGAGPDQEKINDLIIANNLANRIVLRGQKKDIREIWSNHHILIMPSRVDAAPAVLLEAMACGRTAVCTDIGFVKDWIDDNINGFIAENHEINTFELALINAWEKINSWEEMGILANKKINQTLPKQPEKYFLDQLLNL